MDQKKLQRCARHEACHLAVAAHYGFRIYWARCLPVGQTCVGLPYEPVHLAQHYQNDAWLARRTLRQIIAVAEAPAIILDIPAHSDEIQGDQDILGPWRTAWEAIRAMTGDLSWRFVEAGARMAVRNWYRAPGRQGQVEAIAKVLMKRHVLWAKDWQALGEPPPLSRPTTAVELKPEHVPYSRASWRDYASGAGYMHVLVC
jgi:hypothetical protein